MDTKKIETALRKAFLTSVASAALFFGGMNVARAQTSDTSAVQTVSIENVDTIPWHNDEAYITEMDAAEKVYDARVQSINSNADAQIIKLQADKKIHNTRMWTQGTIRPIANVFQMKANKQIELANEEKIRANAETQLANAETQYLYRQQQIELKYKNAYLRTHAEYGKVKTQQQQTVDSLNNEIKLTQLQIKAEQQKAQLLKLQQQNKGAPQNPAKKP